MYTYIYVCSFLFFIFTFFIIFVCVQEHTQVVCSNMEARKRLTESNGTPAMDFGHMNVVLKCCMCTLVVDLWIGIVNFYYYYYYHHCVFFFWYSFPFPLRLCVFFLVFLEFIKSLSGLRWMCCGGAVAWCVPCTNVVLKWCASDWYMKIGAHREKGTWGRPGLLLVKRLEWELTLGTGKSTVTSRVGKHDTGKSWRDSLNFSFIGGGSEGGGRSVRVGVYSGCRCGVWVWGRLWGLQWKAIGCSFEVVRCGWLGGRDEGVVW